MFRSSIFIQNLRRLSTKIDGIIEENEQKSARATIRKQLNYENKALFGPIIKKPSKKQKNSIKEDNSFTTITSTTSSTLQNSSTPVENDYKSEMYWLLQYKHSKQIIEETKDGNNIKKKPKKSKRKKGNDTTDDNVKIAKDKILNKNPIPFRKKDLKNLLKFPMISSDENSNFLKNSQTPPKYGGSYPSVSKILQATMSETARKNLMNWKINKISELGEDGFNKLQQDHLRKGKMLHESLQTYLLNGEEPTPSSEIINLWESVLPTLKILQPKVEFTEIPVEHPFLKYKGVIDCVSKIRDNISIIEWKKSDKHKNSLESTYDAPIQLCAYLGALSADPKYRMPAKDGYVIVAYSDKCPAGVHHMDEITLQKYWTMWLKKVQEYWVRTRDGTLPEPI